jgi:hypothetical protein
MLENYVTIAAALLDADPEAIELLPGLALADSAPAAPFAGFGRHDVYPALDRAGGGPHRAPGSQPPAPRRKPIAGDSVDHEAFVVWIRERSRRLSR